ncbi:MAG: cyanophycinase [Pirellulales bacterium]
MCISTLSVVARADDRGHLLIVGGGQRTEHSQLYERIVAYSGGAEKVKLAIIPTANGGHPEAEGMKRVFEGLGVHSDQITLLEITESNASTEAFSQKWIDAIDQATAVYFQGGVQTRLTRALNPEGRATPVLEAVRRAWQRGATIAGSSAGAAAQSKIMISVSGLHHDLFDEGLDALDYGLTDHDAHRGLFLSEGFGFFTGGIIDQHFNQYRGRLGRLARAVCETDSRFGFGIDENTVIDVASDGTFEVTGEATVTVVDARDASCKDGPLGCSIHGLMISSLRSGDRFDPQSGKTIVHPDKVRTAAMHESYAGNFLISDIAARGSAVDALTRGLADNLRTRQVAVALKHHHHSAHGYRYAFSKTPSTEFHRGTVNGFSSPSAIGLKLDIDPITGSLHEAAERRPLDISDEDDAYVALATSWRRGILLEDEERELRPDDVITRAEFAHALVEAIHPALTRDPLPEIVDVDEESLWYDAITAAISRGWLHVDDRGRFRPDAPLNKRDAASALLAAKQYYDHAMTTPSAAATALATSKPDEVESGKARPRKIILAASAAGLLKVEQGKRAGVPSISRRLIAESIFRLLDLPWADEYLGGWSPVPS